MLDTRTIRDAMHALKPSLDLLGQLRHDVSTDAEALANVMLAYRHVEDAYMRLHCAIQALEDSGRERPSVVGV